MARFDDHGFQYDNPAFHYDTGDEPGRLVDPSIVSPAIPASSAPHSIQYRPPKIRDKGRDFR